MILGFKTQINGKPTHFVEKIWSLVQYRFAQVTEKGKVYLFPLEYFECLERGFQNTLPFKPKLHSMREDKNDRWYPGMMIDFFINVRTKDMFRFAPKIPVISIQKITIGWSNNVDNLKMIGKEYDRQCVVFIDDKFFGDAIFNKGILISSSYNFDLISCNDGFDTVQDFFNYFDKDFDGKIIHWTDKRY